MGSKEVKAEQAINDYFSCGEQGPENNSVTVRLQVIFPSRSFQAPSILKCPFSPGQSDVVFGYEAIVPSRLIISRPALKLFVSYSGFTHVPDKTSIASSVEIIF